MLGQEVLHAQTLFEFRILICSFQHVQGFLIITKIHFYTVENLPVISRNIVTPLSFPLIRTPFRKMFWTFPSSLGKIFISTPDLRNIYSTQGPFSNFFHKVYTNEGLIIFQRVSRIPNFVSAPSPRVWQNSIILSAL